MSNRITYSVKIPNEYSFVTEIAYTFPRKKGSPDGVFIIDYQLFAALPDDAEVIGHRYTGDDYDDVYYGDEHEYSINDHQIPSITMKELRSKRKQFISSCKQ